MMKTPSTTDDPIHDLMRRAIEQTPTAPTFDEALMRADRAGVRSDELIVGAAPRRNRRSFLVVITAVLTSLGLAGGGYLAYATFVGPDGYDSPTEAVNGFVDALSSGNLLRASRALAPFERDHMEERLQAVLGVATESEALSPNDLESAKHISLRPVDLHYAEHPMAADFTRVAVTRGRLELTYSPALLGPIDSGSSGSSPSRASRPKTIDLVKQLQPHDQAGTPAGFVTIRVNGRWYVTLSYSIVDEIRLAKGLAQPDLTTPARAPGAATPQEAATIGFDAVYFGGGRRLEGNGYLKAVDPVSGQAILRYLPSLLDPSNDPDAIQGTSPTSGTDEAPFFRNLRWTVEGDGPWRLARLTSVEVLSNPSDGSDPSALPDPTYETVESAKCADNSHLSDPYCPVVRSTAVALVQRDGRWYIDPIESLGRFLVSNLADTTVRRRQESQGNGSDPGVATTSPGSPVELVPTTIARATEVPDTIAPATEVPDTIAPATEVPNTIGTADTMGTADTVTTSTVG